MVQPNESTQIPAYGRQKSGDFHAMEAVSSAFLERERDVTVWVPPSYSADEERRFPVLYMHDGQQVFDPETSTHGVAWGMDKWVTQLAEAGICDEIIVVAINCSDDRREEYDPPNLGRNYARFVIEELKPRIDADFRTLPDRKHTAVAGASMGGLMSFYLCWVYPHIFGSAACLSSAFRLTGNSFMVKAVKSSDITPDIRLYLYCGNEGELEQKLMKDHLEMKDILSGKGLRVGSQLRFEESEDGQHNEATWSTCVERWLPFLFPAGGHPPSNIPF